MLPVRVGRLWVRFVAILATLAFVAPAVATSVNAQITCAPDLLYVSNLDPATNNLQLFRQTNCGAQLEQLTSDAQHPVFQGADMSPDGTKAVADLANGPTESGTELFIIDLATKKLTKLPTMAGSKIYPQWSPDGQWISFFYNDSTDGSTRGIYVVKIDGTDLRRLTPAGMTGILNGASWSHAGNKLAFIRNQGAGSIFVTVNPDGSGYQEVLTKSNDWLGALPVWSPDDRYLLYTDHRNSHTQIWATDLAGNDLQLTSDNSLEIYWITVANDWSVYYSAVPYSSRDVANEHIYKLYLGDPSVRAQVLATANGETQPSVLRAGTPGPRPAGFPKAGSGGSGNPGSPPTAKVSYVAEGDSYSSGVGALDYFPDSNNPSTFNSCLRSKQAYGPLLDADAKLGGFKFAACSGAVTDDFYVANPVNPGESAQLDQVSLNTKTVTLSIGGNDTGFAHISAKCIDGLRPIGTPEQDRGGYGCSANKALRRDVAARLDALAGKPGNRLLVGRPIHSLADLYIEIHKRAPNARIYVVGYPRLFGTSARNYPRQKNAPSRQACPLGTLRQGVLTFNYRIDYLDALWLDTLSNRLDDIIRTAVLQAARSGASITYVSPSFNGHGLCDSSTSWIHGLEFDGTAISPSTLHPTAIGQKQGYEQPLLAAIK